MPTFQYKARKSSGEIETGTLDAPTQDVLITTLQQKGLMVLSISKITTAPVSGKTYRVKFHNRITSRDMIQFATQLATTLRANIPLLKCLDIQLQQITSLRLKTALEEIRDNVRQGHSLRDSLARYPKIFSTMWINLIETGEVSGRLPTILDHLAEYLIAKSDLRRKTVTALIYPSALVIVSILAIYVFTVKVIPVFAGIFEEFDMELPLITKVVIETSTFLQAYVIHTIIAVGILGYTLYRYINTEMGRRFFDTLSFKIPIFGTFILNSAIEKFSSSLGLLLHSGIPILQALSIVAKTSNNKIVEDALNNAHIAVRAGKSLSSSLARSQIFPPLAVSMCSVGEETGEMGKMLDQIKNYYQYELTVFVERLNATLEPLVIIVMGSVVFVIVLAMYLPIFKIATLGG